MIQFYDLYRWYRCIYNWLVVTGTCFIFPSIGVDDPIWLLYILEWDETTKQIVNWQFMEENQWRSVWFGYFMGEHHGPSWDIHGIGWNCFGRSRGNLGMTGISECRKRQWELQKWRWCNHACRIIALSKYFIIIWMNQSVFYICICIYNYIYIYICIHILRSICKASGDFPRLTH